jgi:hypothetical protein
VLQSERGKRVEVGGGRLRKMRFCSFAVLQCCGQMMVLQSGYGLRLEVRGGRQGKYQMSKSKIQMEIWNNETIKSCNDGINAKSSNDKWQ